MSFSLSARKKLAVCWLWMVAIPSVVLSQGSFVGSGGEYSIVGRLPGDQVHPQLSFTTNGGYIVWEDFWIDGKGLGVGAMRLKNDLTPSGVAFRVDSLVAGDQENAHVSMLNDGGAAFAWQGGKVRDLNLNAFAVNAGAGYNFLDTPWVPRIFVCIPVFRPPACPATSAASPLSLC